MSLYNTGRDTAKWGPKTWYVNSNKVLMLEGLSFSYSQAADNNASTEDKKTTNERGLELSPLTFSTVLHSGAGVDVRAEIESWEALVTKVNDFYLNGKKLFLKLQLKKVNVTVDQLDDLGRMRLATLTFEFKEYQADTTNVKATSTSALNVKASTSAKSQAKTTNTAVAKAATKTIKKGDYVKITAVRYSTGETIPDWVKQRSHVVSQIKGSKVLLGSPNGINSWVPMSGVSLASVHAVSK